MQLITIAAVFALTPLLILPRYFFSYDVTPKIAVVLIGAAILSVLAVRDPGFGAARRLWSHPLGRWYCVLCSAQVISLLASTALSTHPALSWNGGNWRRFGFVLQLAILLLAFWIAAYCSTTAIRIIGRAISLSGLLIAVYGILQYFDLDPFLQSAGYSVGDGITAIVRPPSTLGHADYFSCHLLFVVFFGAILVVTEANFVWKTVGAATAVVSSAAIVLSGTRGAMLGLAAGFVSLWIWKRVAFKRRHAVLAVALCAGAVFFYVSPAGLRLRSRTQWALEDVRGGARLWLWRDSIRMASGRLSSGFGPETFGVEFPRYQSAELSRAYPDFYHESPHDIFVDALVSQGVAGLAILCGFIVLALVAARRREAKRQRETPYLAAALVAALIGGLFVCFTLSGALYFYATVALLTGLATQSIPVAAPAERKVRWRVPEFAFGAIMAGLFFYLAIRLVVSDVAMERANLDLHMGRIEDALKEYRSSQRWHPKGSGDDLYFARALAAASPKIADRGLASLAMQAAFVSARRATTTSEEPQNAWYNLAEFYATHGYAAGVEMCLRRSMEASPNWFKPHWALAQFLVISGHREEALVEAERAADLDGGKQAEIANFLQTLHHSAVPSKAE